MASVVGFALLACGQSTSSPHASPGASEGGDSGAHAGTANADATPAGGANGGTGGSSGGVTSIVTTGGTETSNTPVQPSAAGAGGQPSYPAIVYLCIYPDDIPENWGQGGDGTTDITGRTCTVGVVGDFDFMGCLYELQSPDPFDVDVFSGGHSHCCYAAKLLACK